MNINVNVPDHLVATGDKLAKRMGLSRNELFSETEPVPASVTDDDEDW
jgi:hypothetical protein